MNNKFLHQKEKKQLIQHYAFSTRFGFLYSIVSLFHSMLWKMKISTFSFSKRFIDIVASFTMIVLLTPLLVLVAILIKTESPGPVFFSQLRVGYRGKTFRFWKFRSMYIDAEERKQALQSKNEMSGGVLFKMKNDPRITRIGRFIRKFSIDELPQLWNVLRGDMSLVGPRPALPSEVEQYSIADRYRLDVMPGITCLWQVSGRSEIPFEQQVVLDVNYMRAQSLLEDIKILILTIPAVLAGKGAY